MKMINPSPDHEAFYQEVCVILGKYEERGVPPIQLLALTANVAGKLMAMLDHREFTADEAMQVVCSNLERGNQEIVDRLLGGASGSA